MSKRWWVVAAMLALGGCPSDKDDKAKATDGGADGAGADSGLSSDASTPDDGGKPDNSQVDAGTVEADAGAPDAGGVSYPDELGFELDGVWYPYKMDTAGCSDLGERFFVNQGGANDKGGATSYVVFGADPPATGSYTVNKADGATPPPPGEVSIWFNDAHDMSDYWYSDGTSGTVSVVVMGPDVFDVVWHDVNLVRGAGSIVFEPGTKITSAQGWQHCAPRK